MTQTCKVAHIRYLQGLYADLANTYLEKLNIGRLCTEAERNLLITKEYIKSIKCYEVFDAAVTYAYSFTIVREGTESVVLRIIIGGVEELVYSGDGDLEAILSSFKASALVASNYDLEAEIIDEVLYIYSYDTDLTFTTSTTVTTNDEDEATISAENLQNTYCTILDSKNCLTTEEICDIITHGKKLLNDCNC
jgi:hypothetical protein